MDITVEELYMLLGAKDVQIYKLQQELKILKAQIPVQPVTTEPKV